MVVHGGPGGAGEIGPLARGLAKRGYDVLEPFQTRASIAEQIEELHNSIERFCALPTLLIGWSWGAWLSCLLAAKHPALVQKLILIGSPPFEASFARRILPTRLSRLTEAQKMKLSMLSLNLDDPAKVEEIMGLFDITDNFAPHPPATPEIMFDKTIHDAVWAEAALLRQSGDLLKAIASLRCPITALHGDYDPHPAEGVEQPLRAVCPQLDFIMLRHCGHKPWQEIHACDMFYTTLEKTF